MNNNKIQNIKVYTTNLEIKNNERRNILFSRLPEKNLNSERHDSLLSFWSHSIFDVSKRFNVLIFTPKLLQEIFTINNISPMFLPLVLNEMYKSRNIQSMENFFKEIGWTKWIFDKLVVNPLKNYTSLFGDTNLANAPNQKFVIEEIIKEKVEEVYQKQSEKIHSTIEAIISIGKFEKLIEDWQLSKEEIELIVQVLIKFRYAVLILNGNGERKGLKFKYSSDSERLFKSDETDLGILNLQTTLETLQIQEKELEKDIESIKTDIKKSLRSKQKSNALAQLKKKKKFEEILEKRIQASTNISEILLSIESSQSNQQILDAITTGVSTLKKVNQRISIDQVDEIIDNLEDTLTDQKEIDEAIKQGLSANSMNNFTLEEEQELQDELNALEEQVLISATPIKLPPQIQPIQETVTPTPISTTTKEPLPFIITSKEEEDDLLKELEKLKVNEEEIEEKKKNEKVGILESN